MFYLRRKQVIKVKIKIYNFKADLPEVNEFSGAHCKLAVECLRLRVTCKQRRWWTNQNSATAINHLSLITANNLPVPLLIRLKLVDSAYYIGFTSRLHSAALLELVTFHVEALFFPLYFWCIFVGLLIIMVIINPCLGGQWDWTTKIYFKCWLRSEQEDRVKETLPKHVWWWRLQMRRLRFLLVPVVVICLQFSKHISSIVWGDKHVWIKANLNAFDSFAKYSAVFVCAQASETGKLLKYEVLKSFISLVKTQLLDGGVRERIQVGLLDCSLWRKPPLYTAHGLSSVLTLSLATFRLTVYVYKCVCESEVKTTKITTMTSLGSRFLYRAVTLELPLQPLPCGTISRSILRCRLLEVSNL